MRLTRSRLSLRLPHPPELPVQPPSPPQSLPQPEPSPAIPSAKSEAARLKQRGPHGEFVNLSQDQSGEHLVDLKVHNPLKKIYSVLEDIKKHQETTVAFKFSIPLFALPIALALLFGVGAFQLGRLLPFYPSYPATRVGTLYSLTVTETPARSLWEWLNPFSQKPSSAARPKVILWEADTTLSIEVPATVSLANFHGQLVAATDEVNSCTQSLKVTNTQNVTLLTNY